MNLCRPPLPAGAPLILSISLLAACSFRGGFDDGYRCGVGGSCPSGQMCVDGYCRAGGGADAGDGDASGNPDAAVSVPDGSTPAGRCGTLSLLTDDFADGVPGLQWWDWADTGAAVVETGGHLAVPVQAGSADAWAGYSSSSIYDLTGSTLETTVSQVGARYTVLELRSWDGPMAQLLVEDGVTLAAAVYNTASEGVRATATYDAGVHRHWRLREQDGTLYWETSIDRSDWTELHSEPLPFPVDHVHGILSSGGQLASAGEARFEEINPEPSTVGFCPTATLADDFTAAPLRPIWDPWSETGCTIAETGGALAMTFTGAADVWCGAETWHRYDLRGSSVTFEVAEASVANQFVTYAQVVTPRDSSNLMEIGMENGGIWFQQIAGGTTTDYAEVNWDAAAHRFWRFSEAGGQIRLETSPDGSAWTLQLQAAAGFELDAIVIGFGAGTYGAGPPGTATARFAGVNAP